MNKVEIVTGPLDKLNNLSPPSKAIYYIARNNKLDPVGIISNPEKNVIMRDNAYYSTDSDPAEHVFDSIISYSRQSVKHFTWNNFYLIIFFSYQAQTFKIVF